MRGHAADKSRTFPYEASRVGPLWVMRDAPRKNPRDYRKEEWIAHAVDAREVDAAARRHTRGQFFVCAIIGAGEPDEPVRSAYKSLGYRLLATEAFFVQPLEADSSAAFTRADREGPHARARRTVREGDENAPDPERPARKGCAVPPVCRARRRRHRGPCAERRCGRGDLVHGHACQASHTADTESGRRCSRECCGTTGLAARRARCSSQATPAHFFIRVWAMSGSASC